MKFFCLVYIVVFGTMGLAACQSIKTVQASCQPASDPFPTPITRDPNNIRVVYGPNITVGKVCSFSGRVEMGQVYRHEITDDLAFCLIPATSEHTNDGWVIIISDTMQDSCDTNSKNFIDFSGLVSPPFHGGNDSYIVGFQFRNKDNTATNDGTANPPHKTRGFNFLFNRSDYKAIQEAQNCSMGYPCNNVLTNESAIKSIAGTSKSGGIMTITNIELGNLIPNDEAWIENMEFEVKIYLP